MGINESMIIPGDSDELISLDYDNILALAERADKMVNALKKIMNAALKITTPRDWVLIGGSPYLQESGASKVARLFGISWQILNQYEKLDVEGYPEFHYRMAFTMGNARIECDGSRSSRDDFFAGSKTDKNGNPKKQKSVDEIPLDDVKRAAYTNCLNNGIKRILPGLRNLDMSDLEAAGINLSKTSGYTFKEGSKGGTRKTDETGLKCSNCGSGVSEKVASFSEGKYGRHLCMDCQKTASQKGASEDYPSADNFTHSDDGAPPERERNS